jgi:cellobiose dehydrogenase (acceptor)
MKASIARLYAMQPSTNITSQDGKRYLQSGYDVARKWLVNGLGFKETDINRYKNSKTQVFGHPIYDYSKGQRGGPVTTYLQKALKRHNFHLQSGVRVVRVQRQFDKATAVIVSINGVEKAIRISETGRVILSAGAIQSPSLLMFSGIGDPTVLSKLQSAGKLGGLSSSEWINSTAVGASLFDNPNTFIELQSNTVQSYVYSYATPPISDEDLYLHHRSGPYTFASQTSVFWDTTTRADGSIVAFQGTVDSSGFGGFTDNHTITLNIYGTSGLRSRGKVVLDNNFIPGPSPDVYYSNPEDSADIAAFIYKIFAGLPSAGLTPLNIPQTATAEEINTYITTYSQYARGQVNHWSSSCGIGSCVDVNTTVIGMSNLHVVDASIVAPLTVNPQFGVMAAAERAAELILKMG